MRGREGERGREGKTEGDEEGRERRRGEGDGEEDRRREKRLREYLSWQYGYEWEVPGRVFEEAREREEEG